MASTEGPSTGPSIGLSIGDLSERTEVSVATLRAWERRHGFPVPMRLPSGHRRYAPGDVARVREVVRRREEGVRLESAIARVREAGRTADASVFAALRRDHPHLPVERLHKETLTALSYAMEDEFCAKAEQARIFGAFQEARHYVSSRSRWQELGQLAGSAFVYADFDAAPDLDLTEERRSGAVVPVQVGSGEPLRREWAVVCDSQEMPAALTAWELPGQQDVPDPRRVFEVIWTVEPGPVRRAARVCAGIAAEADPEAAEPVLAAMAAAPVAPLPDLGALNAMFTRVLRYVDRRGAHAERL